MFEISPKTSKLIEWFLGCERGETQSYAKILSETDCDLAAGDRHRVYVAQRALEAHHNRSLICERGRGYKVALANEHVGAMLERKGRARTQMGLARRTADAVAWSDLTEPELARHVEVQGHLAAIEAVITHHDRRLRKIEKHLGLDEATVDGDAVTIDD